MRLRPTLPLLIALPGALIGALALAACDPKPAAPAEPASPAEAPPAVEAEGPAQAAPSPAARMNRAEGPMTLTAMQVRSDERFRAADTNGDGVISGDELAALSAGSGRQSMGGRGLARADADGDGRITLEEARAQVAERFARMDLNGDGAITDDERPQRGDFGGRPGGGRRGGPSAE